MLFQPILFPPKSLWQLPKVLPRVESNSIISCDLETCDPGLRLRGPGAIRNEGYVVGIALAGKDWQVYLPIRHPEVNLPEETVKAYVLYAFKEARTVVFANAPYDLAWLQWLGLDPVNNIKEIHDIQIQEPLIDEEKASYSLNSLSKQYCGRGKEEGGLLDAATAYGVDAKAELFKLPARYVGPYAEADTRLTFDVYLRQREILAASGLLPIAQLEHDLLPIVFRMSQRGIPVDLPKVEHLEAQLAREEDELRKRGREEFHTDIDEWSNLAIARTADRLGLAYPRTEKDNASFKGAFLSVANHPFFRLVDSIREVNRHRAVYLKEWFGANQIRGRIHPTWHQLASDEGGTRTGRMACSQPNAQQVPSRSKYGPAIRSCFVADPGLQWAKLDYSQQEPRILVHYAASRGLRGAEAIAKAYQENPKTDIYKYMEAAAGVERKQAKALFLATIYGMGVDKLSDTLGVTVEDAKAMRMKFHEKFPFVRDLSEEVVTLIERRGWIKTLGGRRRNFNFYEPVVRDKSKGAKRFEEAVREYGQAIKRAYTHKGLNSLIQGGAADMTKRSVIEVYRNLKLVPYMQVHDELDYGVENEKQALDIKEIMEQAYALKVPVVAELELGEHWK